MREWMGRRWLLTCGVLSAFLLALWGLLRNTAYEAEATLEYQPAAAGLSEASWHELLATERAILLSRSVCERAARRLARSTASSHESASLELACKGIEAERVSAARVLRVRASHADAKMATQIVESTAQAYLERHAEQTLSANPSLSAVASELEAQGQELDLLEQEAESFARERGLLTYDAELERNELALLRQELVRGRIREIALDAELKELEHALKTKSYQAHRLAADPAFREQQARLAALGAEASVTTDGGISAAPRAALMSTLHSLALATEAAVRAERELVREQKHELTEYLSFQEARLERRESDLVELRKRRRKVAEHQALRDAFLQWPATASSKPVFVVRMLDKGHVVGRWPSSAAWLRAGLLGLAGLAGAVWAALRVRA